MDQKGSAKGVEQAERQGGWSPKEGGWRKHPDDHVIKSPFCSAKALGQGVYARLKAEAASEFGVKARIRGREITGGRTYSRTHGWLAQLTIIGRGGMDVYKIFLRAAQDARAVLPPDLPHLKKPALNHDPEPAPDPKPPHSNSASQRTAQPLPPPPPGFRVEASSDAHAPSSEVAPQKKSKREPFFYGLDLFGIGA